MLALWSSLSTHTNRLSSKAELPQTLNESKSGHTSRSNASASFSHVAEQQQLIWFKLWLMVPPFHNTYWHAQGQWRQNAKSWWIYYWTYWVVIESTRVTPDRLSDVLVDLLGHGEHVDRWAADNLQYTMHAQVPWVWGNFSDMGCLTELAVVAIYWYAQLELTKYRCPSPLRKIAVKRNLPWAAVDH